MAAAVESARLGLRVFPVRVRDKRPLTRGWRTRATSDVRAVIETWRYQPQANIGVLCGQGHVVLDADSARGEDALRELALPATPAVRTARGIHLYFAGHARGRRRLLPDVELRGARQYVLGAGSIHPTGVAYEWEVPWEVGLACLPDEIRSLAATRRANEPVRALPAVIPQGHRNMTLTRIAGSLRGRVGVSEAALSDALHRENRERCQPPLADEEVERIVMSACGWDQPPAWLLDPAGFAADPRLSAHARFLLRTLADHARPDGVCFPSVRRIRDLTRMASDTIHSATLELEAAGRVSVKRRRRRGNRYRILPWSPAGERVKRSGSYVLDGRTAASSRQAVTA
jgi:hypothetical protein